MARWQISVVAGSMLVLAVVFTIGVCQMIDAQLACEEAVSDVTLPSGIIAPVTPTDFDFGRDLQTDPERMWRPPRRELIVPPPLHAVPHYGPHGDWELVPAEETESQPFS
jgi:hypothetical protein